MSVANVCYWHKADDPECLRIGRDWGKSGRDANMAELTRLTQSRYCVSDLFLCPGLSRYDACLSGSSGLGRRSS